MISPAQENPRHKRPKFVSDDLYPKQEPTTLRDALRGVDLDEMSLPQLLDLRNQINLRLPARNLAGVDLEGELVLQMAATQTLQSSVLESETTPANQKAQVANAVASILGQLVKLQMEIYTSERLKKVEAVLIQTLEHLNTEDQERFFEIYEAELGR